MSADAYAALEAELRAAAADRQHLGVNADRFERAADAIGELTKELRDRELHHFETEQENERLRLQLASWHRQ